MVFYLFYFITNYLKSIIHIMNNNDNFKFRGAGHNILNIHAFSLG